MQSGLKQLITRLRARVPDPVFRYAAPVGLLIVLTGATYLWFDMLGWRNPVFGGIVVLAYFLVLLQAAWMGYGPGLLVLLLTTILSRFLGTTPHTFSRDAVRYLLGAASFCGVLVSRIGQTKRRSEAELKQTAEELEIRVRERTERLQFQTNLLDQINAREEAFRNFLDEAPFAYHEVDTNGIFVRVNRAECEVMGLSAAEIVGRHVWDFATPEERERVSRNLIGKDGTARHAIAPFERKLAALRGERVRLSNSLAPDD